MTLTIRADCCRSRRLVLNPSDKTGIQREFAKSLRRDNFDVSRKAVRPGYEIRLGRRHNEEDSTKVLGRAVRNGVPKIGKPGARAAAQRLYERLGFRRDADADFERDLRRFLVYRLVLGADGDMGAAGALPAAGSAARASSASRSRQPATATRGHRLPSPATRPRPRRGRIWARPTRS